MSQIISKKTVKRYKYLNLIKYAFYYILLNHISLCIMYRICINSFNFQSSMSLIGTLDATSLPAYVPFTKQKTSYKYISFMYYQL